MRIADFNINHAGIARAIVLTDDGDFVALIHLPVMEMEDMVRQLSGKIAAGLEQALRNALVAPCGANLN